MSILKFPPKEEIFLKILKEETIYIEVVEMTGLSTRRDEAIAQLIEHGILDRAITVHPYGQVAYKVLARFCYRYNNEDVSLILKKGEYFTK